ncbi:hypothetical protein GE061_001922 [Apolygus lucorum]|uniref:Uncharacterized protein n=1 Tax=Apolygus lucorum TaxID=248454 RepID=A0A8S9X366_APOLU|nr:hypothetical protein GE061_001922 [Apolygus lucorum]
MKFDMTKRVLFVYAYASSSNLPWTAFKQRRNVVEILSHPKSDGNLLYNQAVLRVQEGFVFDEKFTRAKVFSTQMKPSLAELYDMMFDFRQRRCDKCKHPDFGKYDCKMVSWKVKNYPEPHLRMMEVTLLGYDECDKINTDVPQPPKIIASLCVQPKRIDVMSPQGAEQLSPPEFYEEADEGAPLICSEAGTDRYKLWGTYSTPMYSRSNNTNYRGKVVYVCFTSIESLLYGYHFEDPYGRKSS